MKKDHYDLARGVTGSLAQVAGTIEKSETPQAIEELVRSYFRIKDVAEETEAALKRIKAVQRTLATEIIPEQLDDQGVTNISAAVDDGTIRRFARTTRLAASPKADKKPECFAWLRANGLEDLIQETVNAQTLSATARTMVEDGEDLPEEFFNVAYLNNTSVTKVK